MKKIDNGELLKSIIALLVSMGIAHIDEGSAYKYSSYKPLADHLGLSHIHSLLRFIREEMDTYIWELDFELYLKPLARAWIEFSSSALDLLKMIGWEIPAYSFKQLKPFQLALRIDRRMHRLFGTTYERAKIQYSSGYIGDDI